MISAMSNESTFDGIRLAYVHFSVTASRGSDPRGVPAAGFTRVAPGADHGRWGRVVQPRQAARPAGLAA